MYHNVAWNYVWKLTTQNVLKISANYILEKLFKFSILPLLSCECIVSIISQHQSPHSLVFSEACMHESYIEKPHTQEILLFMCVIDTFDILLLFYLHIIKIIMIILNFCNDNVRRAFLINPHNHQHCHHYFLMSCGVDAPK